HDPGAGVSKLGDDFAGLGAQNLPLGQWGLAQVVRRFVLATRVKRAKALLREITAVNRLNRAAVVFRDVPAAENPFASQRRQAFLDRAGEIGVAPGTGAIVNADWLVDFDLSAERPGGSGRDFAHRHADIFVDGAGHVDPPAVG